MLQNLHLHPAFILRDKESNTPKSPSYYPPYSIATQKRGDETIGFIYVACTGLTQDDVQVYFDEDTLVIEGDFVPQEEQEKQEEMIVYTHKGLSTKGFKRKFKLEKNYKVKEVTLKNGLMRIELNKEVPEKQLITINPKSSRPDVNSADSVDSTEVTSPETPESFHQKRTSKTSERLDDLIQV